MPDGSLCYCAGGSSTLSPPTTVVPEKAMKTSMIPSILSNYLALVCAAGVTASIIALLCHAGLLLPV